MDVKQNLVIVNIPMQKLTENLLSKGLRDGRKARGEIRSLHFEGWNSLLVNVCFKYDCSLSLSHSESNRKPCQKMVIGWRF